MSATLWVLKYCELFGRLSPEQITRIESRSRSRSFPARSPVCLPTEKADSVFIVIQGRLKVGRTVANGQQSMPVFVEPGELFGETAIFDGDTPDDHVEAVAPSTVVMIPGEEMRHLMAEGADVALSITKLVGLRRHCIQRRLRNLLFMSHRERLVQLLLDLAEQFGRRRDQDDGIRLRIKLSHWEQAYLIGSTREAVAVLLGQLKAEGSIGGVGRSVVLTNPQRLVRV